MKTNLITLLLTTLLSTHAFAFSIDYRHEVQDRAENTHKDRLLLSHRFANGFGLSSEVKWKTGDSDAENNKIYHENTSDGFEVTSSYLYGFNKIYSLEGGLNIVSDSGYTNYRPYIKSIINITEDVNWSLRYRPFYKRYSANRNTEKETSENGVTITSVLGYRFLSQWGLDYELEYHKTNTAFFAPVANNKSYQWTHDLKLAYSVDKNWKPYFAIGNVSGSKYTDERQTRYRVGVTYNF